MPTARFALASLLTGFTGEEQELAGAVLYGNSAFAGGWISMAPPLSDDIVTYADGTPATVDQMAKDVSAFLVWTAEPKLENRHRAGFGIGIFLLIATVLAYFSYRNIWAGKKH